jgi:hypothetical protein
MKRRIIMEILIGKIKSNPFRDIEKYPLNRDKVEALKQSIEETGLWKNAFCVRCIKEDKKDKYELVFGHHTLQAAKELGFKKIEVIVEDNISDEMMIKRMANENMEIWGPVTSTILETIGAVKEYIENELNKCESWELLNKFIKQLFKDDDYSGKGRFEQLKKDGIGQTIILNFLGKPWKRWQVQDALKIINNEKINISAVEKMGKLSEATEAAIILNEYDVDEEDQEEIVDEIKEEISKRSKKTNKKKRREIAEDVIENKGYEKEEKESREYHKTKELNESIIRKCLDSLIIVNGTLIEILENWNYCDKEEKNKLLRSFIILFRILKKHNDKIEIK